MNYFIIFTEISLYPETILLQIITNNSCDISDLNQILTDRADSLPILHLKGIVRKETVRNTS